MNAFFDFLQTEPFIAGIITGIFLLVLLASPREQEIIIVRESFLVSFLRSVVLAVIFLFFLLVFGTTEQQLPQEKSPRTEEPPKPEKYVVALEDISKEEAQECQRWFGSRYQVKFLEEYETLLIGVFPTEEDARHFLRENSLLYMYNPTPGPI